MVGQLTACSYNKNIFQLNAYDINSGYSTYMWLIYSKSWSNRYIDGCCFGFCRSNSSSWGF